MLLLATEFIINSASAAFVLRLTHLSIIFIISIAQSKIAQQIICYLPIKEQFCPPKYFSNRSFYLSNKYPFVGLILLCYSVYGRTTVGMGGVHVRHSLGVPSELAPSSLGAPSELARSSFCPPPESARRAAGDPSPHCVSFTRLQNSYVYVESLTSSKSHYFGRNPYI